MFVSIFRWSRNTRDTQVTLVLEIKTNGLLSLSHFFIMSDTHLFVHNLQFFVFAHDSFIIV